MQQGSSQGVEGKHRGVVRLWNNCCSVCSTTSIAWSVPRMRLRSLDVNTIQSCKEAFVHVWLADADEPHGNKLLG